jgi:hypothetical protein
MILMSLSQRSAASTPFFEWDPSPQPRLHWHRPGQMDSYVEH